MNDIVRKEFDDRVEYRLDGKLHRLDGPAVEFADGDKYWYIDGQSYDQDEFLKMKEDQELEEALEKYR